MNILPFVFTFLLLLTLMSSFMFSSTIRSSREKEILQTAHQTYLALLSKQQKALYLQKKPKEEKKTSSDAKRSRIPKHTLSIENFRDSQKGATGSKLHLFAMIHGSNGQLSQHIELILSRLIENLYGACPFYKHPKEKNIAEYIVKEMVDQKIKTLEALILKDPELDAIYYKILKGTSSSYPPLSDYCHLDKNNDPPIRLRFASTPVMQAALGKELSAKLFSLEKASQQENPRKKSLAKEAFLQLLHSDPSSDIPPDLEPLLFNYQNGKKGVCQMLKDGRTQIRASHEVER